MSQELKEENRDDVIEGLGKLGTERGEEVARLVGEKGALKRRARI
jgi:hypothetical protein